MAWLFYLSSGAQRSMNGTGLGLTCFWAPSLEQGVNVPSSSRARRSSQSGSLPREGHGHSVLPKRAPSQEEHVGLRPCDRAAAQVTADMASRRICARASPWVGHRAGQQRGPQEQPRQLLVHFITVWLGKIEVPVASYLSSSSRCPQGACLMLP